MQKESCPNDTRRCQNQHNLITWEISGKTEVFLQKTSDSECLTIKFFRCLRSKTHKLYKQSLNPEKSKGDTPNGFKN